MKNIMSTVSGVGLDVASACDQYIVDENGEMFIDWFNDNGVSPLGYNNQILNNAAIKAIVDGTPNRQPQIYGSSVAREYSSVLCDRFSMDKVFFSNSGAESGNAAIKIARLATNKLNIVTLPNQFHGRCGFTMAASDSAPYHREGFGVKGENFILWQPEPDCEHGSPFSRHYDNGRVPMETEDIDWDTVAAIMLAPVLGNNVVEPYPAWIWDKINYLQEKHSLLVIFDEVQTGMGRCGYYSASHSRAIPVKPDIICLGKGIAGGWPIAATLARGHAADAFFAGSHFSTFGGSSNAIMSVGMAFIHWLDYGLENLRDNMVCFQHMLEDVEGIDKVYRFGAMVAILPDYHGYDAKQLSEKCIEYGLMAITFRTDGVIKIYPPLNSTLHNLKEGVAILRLAIRSLKEQS